MGCDADEHGKEVRYRLPHIRRPWYLAAATGFLRPCCRCDCLPASLLPLRVFLLSLAVGCLVRHYFW